VEYHRELARGRRRSAKKREHEIRAFYREILGGSALNQLETDGLTDAPANQAVPIEELLELLGGDEGDEPVELLADSIRPLKRRRRPRGSADDTAIVVLRFGVASIPDDALPRDEADVAASATV
jgi:hypothetical protein